MNAITVWMAPSQLAAQRLEGEKATGRNKVTRVCEHRRKPSPFAQAMPSFALVTSTAFFFFFPQILFGVDRPFFTSWNCSRDVKKTLTLARGQRLGEASSLLLLSLPGWSLTSPTSTTTTRRRLWWCHGLLPAEVGANGGQTHTRVDHVFRFSLFYSFR